MHVYVVSYLSSCFIAIVLYVCHCCYLASLFWRRLVLQCKCKNRDIVKCYFRNKIKSVNRLDQDQSDLGPNCLQRSSAMS